MEIIVLWKLTFDIDDRLEFTTFFKLSLWELEIFYKNTDEWYIEWQRVTTSGTTIDNEWQRVATSSTTNYNERQRVKTNYKGWQ